MSETNEEAVLPMGLTDNPDEGGPAPWPAPGPMSDQRAKPRVVWKRVWKAVLVAAPFVVVKTLIGLGGDDKLRDYPDETERDETGETWVSALCGWTTVWPYPTMSSPLLSAPATRRSHSRSSAPFRVPIHTRAK